MKICIYTDNHYAQYSSILRNRGSKYSVRLENQIESLNWVEELSAQTKCDRVVCLGDFFDKPELNAEELTALKSIKWNKDATHIFLVGNHEMGSNDLEYSSTPYSAHSLSQSHFHADEHSLPQSLVCHPLNRHHKG